MNKHHIPFHRLLLPIALATCALAHLAGCASKPRPISHALSISVDKSLENTSLQIDILGANATSDIPKWEGYSITEYWQPGNTTRRDTDRVTLDFGRGRPTTQTIPATDPHWARWLSTGAASIVVIADLPGVQADRAGNADPRRLILPLDANQWLKAKNAPLEILVQESGLRLLTPRKP